MERFGVVVFRFLLLFLPRRLRVRAGAEMTQIFMERQRRARGAAGFVAVWSVEFGGVLLTALRSRFEGRWSARRRGPHSNRTRRSSVMDTIAQDLRFGMRTLVRRPVTAVLAVLTLGLGVATSTAMFSVVDAVLLRDLPFPEPDRVVSLYVTNPVFENHPTLGDAAVRGTFSYPEFADLEENAAGALESVAILGWGSGILAGSDGPAERITLAGTSPGLFTGVLRVQPVAGRFFGPEDEGVQGRIVLTEGLWERKFGRDPGLIGSTVDIGGVQEVIGIAPRSAVLSGWDDVEAWVLTSPRENRGDHSWLAIGRLADGVTVERGAAMLTASLRAAAPPGETHDHAVNVFARQADETRNVRGPLTLLGAAALVLLLVACGNVAVLLLGAAIDRERELSVRGALGAGRRRILQQLLTESLVLAGAGALVGLLLTRLATNALVLLAPDRVPHIAEAAVDGRVLTFGVGVAFLCGVLFGLAPALLASRTDLAGSMTATRGSTNAGRARLQSILVGCELAMATVLLVGAGLLGRTVLALNAVDTGYAVEHLLSVRLSMPWQQLLEGIEGEDDQLAVVHARQDEVLDRIRGVAGVRDVAWTSVMPLSGDRANNDIQPDGYTGDPIIAERRFVSANYFDVLGVRIIEGRAFDESDDRVDAAGTMIVSEGIARLVWPDRSPIGERVTYWERETTVVGVAAAIRDEGIAQATDFAFYVPRRQAVQPYGNLVIRAEGDPTLLIPAIREAIWAVDRGIAIPEVRPFRDHFAAEIGGQRYRARLVIVFSMLAAVFALMGVYGVTSRSVAARTRELGIRLALGAERGNVLGLVMGQAFRMAFWGGLIGLWVAFVTTRAIEAYLWGVERTDPMTLVGTAVLVGGASLLAALAPGRRAARVDPMEALRAE
jgi:putative ABC transport system permease protein